MLKHIVPPDEVLQPQAVDAENWLVMELIPAMETNYSVIQFLAHRGLLANQKMCGHCRAQPMTFQTYVRILDGYIWRCSKCRMRKTIRDGSFFLRSKLPLKIIVLIIYFWAEEFPQKFVVRQLSIDKKTCIDWYNFIRGVCCQYQLLHPVLLGGFDKKGNPIEVEIDISHHFHRSGNQHVKWVFGAYERGSRRYLIVEVPELTSAALEVIIRRCILPGTRILSQALDMYEQIHLIRDGIYMHDTVAHSDGLVEPHPDVHTQNVEGMWTTSKRLLKFHFGTNGSLFTTYLAQFIWENEMKVQGRKKFNGMVNCIREVHPV